MLLWPQQQYKEHKKMNENSCERPRIGLGVLLFNPIQQILLGKRKGSHGEGDWGPPGGHLEFNESFESCAIREVFEETNLEITSPEFLAITNDFFEAEKKHYVSIFMKASYPNGQKINNQEPHKVETWQWFSLTSLPHNLFLPLKRLMSGKFYGTVQPPDDLFSAHLSSLRSHPSISCVSTNKAQK
jgi:8-oxo-dGTP diphosphatase